MNNKIFLSLVQLKTATQSLFSFEDKRVITKSEAPEEYASILALINSHIEQGTIHQVLNKLSSSNLEFKLDCRDWMKIYEQNVLKKIVFKLDENSLQDLSGPDLKNFIRSELYEYQNFRTYDRVFSKTVYKNIDEFKYFLTSIFNAGLISTDPERANDNIRDGINAPPSLTCILKEINSNLKHVQEYPAIHKDNIKFLKELKSFCLNLSDNKVSSNLNTLVDKINKQKSVFAPLPENHLLQIEDLGLALTEINQKGKELGSIALSSKVVLITSSARALVTKDWLELSVEEQVRLKTIIQKDLPDLIFNYLSIDKNIRDDLVIKSSQKTLADSLKESFESILLDLNLMDKTQQKQDKAVNNIEITRLHLNSR